MSKKEVDADRLLVYCLTMSSEIKQLLEELAKLGEEAAKHTAELQAELEAIDRKLEELTHG